MGIPSSAAGETLGPFIAREYRSIDRSRRIAGAALDVTETEPLPADSARGDAPNLLLTPRAAADGRELRNVVDR